MNRTKKIRLNRTGREEQRKNADRYCSGEGKGKKVTDTPLRVALITIIYFYSGWRKPLEGRNDKNTIIKRMK